MKLQLEINLSSFLSKKKKRKKKKKEANPYSVCTVQVIIFLNNVWYLHYMYKGKYERKLFNY